MPCKVLLMMASRDESTMAAKCARASSEALRSDASRNTRTAPTVAPEVSRIGAALASIGCSRPWREIRTVWLVSLTMPPVCRARIAGLPIASRLPSGARLAGTAPRQPRATNRSALRPPRS